VQLVPGEEQRDEHGRIGAAVDLERGRGRRLEQDLLQLGAEVGQISRRG
jgi:hypothetical protein